MNDLDIKLQKQEQTLFNDLRQGISKRTRGFISHYDFRMGCDPPSPTGWFKITRWFISHYDFRMGCDPPPLQQGDSKIQGGSSPTMISEWGVTPPPPCNRVVQKIQCGSSPTSTFFLLKLIKVPPPTTTATTTSITL